MGKGLFTGGRGGGDGAGIKGAPTAGLLEEGITRDKTDSPSPRRRSSPSSISTKCVIRVRAGGAACGAIINEFCTVDVEGAGAGDGGDGVKGGGGPEGNE